MIGKIKNFWCHKVLPLTYDDSLSYYEVLCKLTAKVNEVIQYVQEGWGENILEILREIIQNLNIGYTADTETLTIDYEDESPTISTQEIARINASGISRGLKDSTARTNIANLTESMQKLNADVLAEMAAHGILTQANREIHVKASGGGDYTSLVEAVNSVVEGEGTIIYLYEGTYDVSSASGLGLTLPDKCYIVGVGDRLNIQIRCNLGADNAYFSAVNYTKNCGLFNVYVYCNHGRYVIHDDADEYNKNNKRITYFCILEGYNLTYQYAYGAGIKGGATAVIKDCVIINNNQKEAISFHNMTRAHDSSYIVIENCVLFGGKNTGGCTVRLAAVMDYNDSTVTKPVYVNGFNNTNFHVTFDKEYGSGNPFILKCNGICKFRAINSQVIPWGEIVNHDMMTKPYPYSLEGAVAGYPIFYNTPMESASLISLPNSLVQGVIIVGTSNANANVIVMHKGYVPLTQIGLSGSAGQWINLVENSDNRKVLEVSSTRGTAIGFIDNTQQAFIDVSMR